MLNNNSRLQEEIWFHGSIGRQQAEALLKQVIDNCFEFPVYSHFFSFSFPFNSKSVRQDGDFLVRESQGSPGQYVLTGIQGGIKKHLLLIDPEGVVSKSI